MLDARALTREYDFSPEPIVLGGTGGSGTRVFARLLLGAGVFMGCNRNPADDSREFIELYNRWINRVAGAKRGALDDADRAMLDQELEASMKRHRDPMPDPRGRWGWKEPRSVFMLPILHRHFPRLKFIHIVRDGRDMALSRNQNQLRKHGETFLGDAEAALPPAERSLLLWSRNNLAAADYGEANMPGSYLRLRFENLCEDPVGITRSLFHFLGLGDALDVEVVARREVSAPDTLGRWRRSGERFPDLSLEVSVALERFGFPL